MAVFFSDAAVTYAGSRTRLLLVAVDWFAWA